MSDARPQATHFTDPNPPGVPGIPGAGHAPEMSSVRGVVWFAVGIVVLLILSHVVLIGLYLGLRAEQRAKDPVVSPFAGERSREVPPPPRLETEETEGLRRLREAEAVSLESPAWFDEKTGRGHVPIEKAMEMVVAGERASGVSGGAGRRRRERRRSRGGER